MNEQQYINISIIIPYYNTSEYVKECLDSVLSQTHENIEVILINDGSNDGDTAFVETLLNDDRIIYVKNSTNKGVGYSRNIGLKKANGKYVYFLDSDDLLTKKSIQLLLENINDSPAIIGTTKKFLKPADTEINVDFTVGEFVEDGKNLLNEKSMLNILIRNDFIKENSIHFSENTVGFSDLSAILKIIEKVKNIPKLKMVTYYKRVRNDPIYNPSINQLAISVRTKDFIKAYIDTKNIAETNVGHYYLDSCLLKYYRKNVINIFNNIEHFNEIFELISSAFSLLNLDRISSQPYHIKKELYYIKNYERKKFKKVMWFHKEIKDLLNALKGITKFKLYVYKKIFVKLPMKENYVVFESFLGKNYSDSPRNIYEYIINNNLDFKCIWVFNNRNKKIPGNAKVVKRFSIAYFYYFAISKYWVLNMRQPVRLKKREGNVFLQTWHGTPLKKLVFDIKEIYSADPNYKRDFFIQSRAWDYLISPNAYSSEIFRSAFKFDKEMLELGYPRNDILYSHDKDERASRVKKSIGIPYEKKVVLYAPTWRDDEFYQSGKYKFDLKLDLMKMKEKLGDEYAVALRMHYFISDNLNLEGLEGFAYNLSKYDDIAELYLISDILITDYSSVFFDYANLKRPILFYTYDLEKYRDLLRGFYLDFENEAPGPLLKTSEEVIHSIENIERLNRDYENKYAAFYDKFCSWHDGMSTEKIVKKVFLTD